MAKRHDFYGYVAYVARFRLFFDKGGGVISDSLDCTRCGPTRQVARDLRLNQAPHHRRYVWNSTSIPPLWASFLH